jgi:hypothetical protein
VTIFELARMRRLALIALYLEIRASEAPRRGGSDYAGWYAAGLAAPGQLPMSNEKLVAVIAATRTGAWLLAEPEVAA